MRGMHSYRQSQVRSASNLEIVQMLFQEAVKRLDQARRAPAGSRERIAHLHHVRLVYMELDTSLDYEGHPDFAGQMHALYSWCLATLIRTAHHDDIDLEDVITVTEDLAEGWMGISRTAVRSA